MIVTAVLTTGIVRVASGLEQSQQLIDEVLRTNHAKWETTMFVGDAEFRSTKEGPQPDHQLRISVIPSAGLAALNYMDHDDPEMVIANSYNPARPLPEVSLLFNGETGAVFPRTASIPIADARTAMIEWIQTRKRPKCIQWRPYDNY
ncbi:Imm1 family immunity protein [Lentzea sp. BCCO 10_0798]|uniref:Imm1 family immunity protein n=1 Tax=Lentzea kristufekii TaxID=3095430 RepID=A0ABU4TUN2_9PSEU|nr:Imm1 family immunity protein [Lentzea sp. BCCO 10_0798]MDX8052011.1 Imm1 family immunity protein [Lentzea sp. BCCO 10_0798]